jgi:hypothetical protein
VNDLIPTHHACMTPYLRLQDDGNICLTYSDASDRMVNMILTPARFARLLHDGATILMAATAKSQTTPATNT